MGNISPHYVGERGEAYARWQLAVSNSMGAVNARKFAGHVNQTHTVLDFGCGSGELLAVLQCARRIGVEPNEVSRAVARSNGIETHASLSEVPASSIDVAVTNHALEHCTRPLDELIGIRRVLKAGGTLLVVVPMDDWRTQRIYDATDINHHLYAWSPQLLGNLLADAGFRVGSITVLTHAWPPRVRVWRRLPTPIFDAVCYVWAVAARRRQILAVAGS